MNASSLEDISDDEVFFGEISLKECKKRLFINSCCDRQSLPNTFETKKENKYDDSIQIIETNSEPNVSYARPSLSSPDPITNVTKSDWDIKSSDDSFLQLEKMVSEMCMSPKSNNNDNFNNTLEIVDNILNNPITKENNHKGNFFKSDLGCVEPIIKKSPIKLLNCYDKLQFSKTKPEMINDGNDHLKLLQNSLSKMKVENNNSNYVNTETLVVTTPIKQTEHVFKTPKNMLSTKKQFLATSTKKTPNKINAYQHITSPIAFYINKCPQVPLIKDVHRKKLLNNSTGIPKIVNTPKEHKTRNKENIYLPSVAYKSAKETKMIPIPDAKKLPSGPWVKKMSTSLPKPVVIKHTHREVKPTDKYSISKTDDSFVGLPLKQADLSVCTTKTAFTKII